MDRSNQSKRFETLDALRGVTVMLAMLDHVKVQFVTDLHVLVPLTRLATPCFIILFGAMIEIAYLSKMRAGSGMQSVRQRMAARLITCAGLSTVLTGAAMLSGNLDLVEGGRALVGMGMGRFNEILLIYTALFAILMALLPLLSRHGAVTVLAIAAVNWAVRPALAEAFPEPAHLLNFSLGLGTGYGPALLPAMTFLGFGLAVGEMLTGRRGALLPILLVVLAAMVAASELSHGVLEAGRRFLANRWINHHGYFAVGILGFVGMSGVLFAVRNLHIVQAPMRGLAKIGTQSLFVYGAGNLILNLIPVVELSRVTGFLMAFLFLVSLAVLALMGPARRNILGMGVPARWSWAYGAVCQAVIARLLPGGRAPSAVPAE